MASRSKPDAVQRVQMGQSTDLALIILLYGLIRGGPSALACLSTYGSTCLSTYVSTSINTYVSTSLSTYGSGYGSPTYGSTYGTTYVSTSTSTYGSTYVSLLM